MWERRNDSVWTRLDRWSRWGMNSCRRGLADRTWSVTRWLWRDRYTLSCLEENNYTQALQAQFKAPTHLIHSFISFYHFHLIVIHHHVSVIFLFFAHGYDYGLQWAFVQLNASRLLSLWPLQNKDLKSRVAHLEGSQKSNKEGLVVQLEDRIQELEERLEGEERWAEDFNWEKRWGEKRGWRRKTLEKGLIGK